ncbi:MAG: hypothetical protein GQ574_08775 [Crocinitomix sp.]|nr:hypothetical protein [Crocinitomix sp.]
MIVKDFTENCKLYKDFQIWDVTGMDDFMSDNPVLNEIFLNDYKMTYVEAKEDRSKIKDSNLTIMNDLLDQIGDKHFYIFTWHDDNHAEVVHMQDTKVMNWGVNIGDIEKDHVYIVMMDKIEKPMA